MGNKIKSTLTISIFLVIFTLTLPAQAATTFNVSSGDTTDIGSEEVKTGFRMFTGSIVFKLGNFSWVPDEIWLIPKEIEPDIFSKGLTQEKVIEMPKNVTSSTCGTAIYHNESIGYGFKIYNTASTEQIFSNGTFCGLAYNETYFMFAKY